MLGGIIKSLNEFNRKSIERSKRRVGDMKNSFKTLSDVGKTKSAASEKTVAISETNQDSSSQKTLYPISESIKNSTTKIKEKSAKRKAEHAAKMETLYKKRDEERLKMDRSDPGRKKTLHSLFVILSIGISIPLVIYDKWPAIFFKRVEFLQNLRRGELYVFIFTGMIIFLLLFPIHYYFLRRAAKRVVLNSEKEYDQIEKTEYEQNANNDKNDVE